MERRKRIYFSTLAIIVLSFITLTIFVLLHPFSAVDAFFSKEVQLKQTPLINELMLFISTPGNMPYYLIMVCLTSLLLYIGKYKREAVFVLLTLLAGLISLPIKVLINRPRPTEELVKILEINRFQSFPSGHVLFYVVYFGFMLLIFQKLRWRYAFTKWLLVTIAFLFIITIPISRIYLGAHWFTDVMAGFLIGLFYLGILAYLYLFKRESFLPFPANPEQ